MKFSKHFWWHPTEFAILIEFRSIFKFHQRKTNWLYEVFLLDIYVELLKICNITQWNNIQEKWRSISHFNNTLIFTFSGKPTTFYFSWTTNKGIPHRLFHVQHRHRHSHLHQRWHPQRLLLCACCWLHSEGHHRPSSQSDTCPLGMYSMNFNTSEYISLEMHWCIDIDGIYLIDWSPLHWCWFSFVVVVLIHLYNSQLLHGLTTHHKFCWSSVIDAIYYL